MKYSTPLELITVRMQALRQGDFGPIYDSYHAEAPFLMHFATKADYLAFAEQQLANIVLSDWKDLGQREIKPDEVEILLWMSIGEGSAAQDFFELALLLQVENGWLYHSAQKLSREDYVGEVENLNFCHFDQAEQKIRF